MIYFAGGTCIFGFSNANLSTCFANLRIELLLVVCYYGNAGAKAQDKIRGLHQKIIKLKAHIIVHLTTLFVKIIMHLDLTIQKNSRTEKQNDMYLPREKRQCLG